MSDKIYLGKRAQTLNTSPEFSEYSKVIININDDLFVSAGDDTGLTLELECPWGTTEMAEDILQRLNGFHYRPYEAQKAQLDPAAELGDGITLNGLYSGIFNRTTTFGRKMTADLKAPQDEDIDHEFPYKSRSDRKFTRKFKEVSAEFLLQAQQISAKVSQSGGDDSSFGWSLLANEFALFSNGSKVFSATSEGISVDGRVTAREGFIGNGQSGFTISATAIYNNIPYFGADSTTGIYLGTEGIQLGQNFKVDASGRMECTDAVVSGTLSAGDIKYGTDLSTGKNYGTFNGGGISSNSIGTGQLTSYVGGGISGGITFNKATDSTSNTYPSYFRSKIIVCATNLIASDKFTFGEHEIKKKSIIVKNSSGENELIYYLGWL